MPDVVESRIANAFFENANVSEDMIASLSGKDERSGFTFLDSLPKIISRQVGTGRRRQGGLWVGGKSVLTTSTLSFIPNALNQTLHSSPENLEIDILLSGIISTSIRRGIITDIIDIRSDVRDLSIRCFKARSFAAAIDATRLAAR